MSSMEKNQEPSGPSGQDTSGRPCGYVRPSSGRQATQAQAAAMMQDVQQVQEQQQLGFQHQPSGPSGQDTSGRPCGYVRPSSGRQATLAHAAAMMQDVQQLKQHQQSGFQHQPSGPSGQDTSGRPHGYVRPSSGRQATQAQAAAMMQDVQQLKQHQQSGFQHQAPGTSGQHMSGRTWPYVVPATGRRTTPAQAALLMQDLNQALQQQQQLGFQQQYMRSLQQVPLNCHILTMPVDSSYCPFYNQQLATTSHIAHAVQGSPMAQDHIRNIALMGHQMMMEAAYLLRQGILRQGNSLNLPIQSGRLQATFHLAGNAAHTRATAMRSGGTTGLAGANMHTGYPQQREGDRSYRCFMAYYEARLIDLTAARLRQGMHYCTAYSQLLNELEALRAQNANINIIATANRIMDNVRVRVGQIGIPPMRQPSGQFRFLPVYQPHPQPPTATQPTEALQIWEITDDEQLDEQPPSPDMDQAAEGEQTESMQDEEEDPNEIEEDDADEAVSDEEESDEDSDEEDSSMEFKRPYYWY